MEPEFKVWREIEKLRARDVSLDAVVQLAFVAAEKTRVGTTVVLLQALRKALQAEPGPRLEASVRAMSTAVRIDSAESASAAAAAFCDIKGWCENYDRRLHSVALQAYSACKAAHGVAFDSAQVRRFAAGTESDQLRAKRFTVAAWGQAQLALDHTLNAADLLSDATMAGWVKSALAELCATKEEQQEA